MHGLDYAIVLLYLIALLASALWLARRAGASADDYFLGGRRMPWWALGASGMASNLDVAGTMTIIAMLSLYGLHGFWIELRGGVVLPIAVFAAFMGKWHRRSQVMTTAEWMLLRFGETRAAKSARAAAALTYVAISVAMIVFFVAASGRFLAEFLPFGATTCALGTVAVAFAYTLIGGFYGVVWTDVVQAALIAGAAVYVAVTAFAVTPPEVLERWSAAPLNTFLPRWSGAELAPYTGFAGFLAVWALKGVLEGLGGSGGSAYMAQRFYAAETDRDCRRIGMLWTVFFAVRWPMVLGFVLLGLHLGLPMQSESDVESVLPRVIGSELFGPGIRGLVIAALLAAAMSTFDSTVNAGASYLVRDLYQPLRPSAGSRELVLAGYAGSALLVASGTALALGAQGSVLGIWTGIVMQLFPAFLVPFALRWFWARFNAPGFTWAILAGFGAALWFWLTPPASWHEAAQFLAITAVSLVAAVVATFATEPVPIEVLRSFYTSVRPFGLWPRAWRASDASEHREDVASLLVALAWQLVTFLIPMGLLLRMWGSVAVAFPLWALLGWRLARR